MAYTAKAELAAVLTRNKPYCGHKQIDELDSVYTLKLDDKITHLLLQVNGGDIRYVLSGESPSETFGFLLPNGAMITIPTKGLTEINFIGVDKTPVIEMQLLS